MRRAYHKWKASRPVAIADGDKRLSFKCEWCGARLVPQPRTFGSWGKNPSMLYHDPDGAPELKVNTRPPCPVREAQIKEEWRRLMSGKA